MNSSFSYNNQSSKYHIFLVLILINFVTMVDRSVIPGASLEFSSFCIAARDSPNFIKDNPDAGIGITNAVFIVGYAVSVVITSHLTHFVKWGRLVNFCIGIWIIGVIISGLAGSEYIESFYLLLVSRVMTGVAESAYGIVTPVIIQDRGGIHKGLWLSVYVAMVPFGLAVGYIYGSVISNYLHWSYCYYIMAFITTPLFLASLSIKDHINDGMLTSDEKENSQNKFTFYGEFLSCIKSKIYLSIICADAVQMAVVGVFGTFGGVIVLALGIYDDEKKASSIIGITLAFAGIFGTSFGGMIVDKILEKSHADSSSLKALTVILPVVALGGLIGISFFWLSFFGQQSPFVFLSLAFLGFFFISSIQSGIMYSTLLSVDKDLRPNALAYATLWRHFFGDVPIPIFFGYIKDTLAPACNINVDKTFDDPEKCVEQKNGILTTMALCFSYFCLFFLFIEIAHWLTIIELRREEKLKRHEEECLVILENKTRIEFF